MNNYSYNKFLKYDKVKIQQVIQALVPQLLIAKYICTTCVTCFLVCSTGSQQPEIDVICAKHPVNKSQKREEESHIDKSPPSDCNDSQDLPGKILEQTNAQFVYMKSEKTLPVIYLKHSVHTMHHFRN